LIEMSNDNANLTQFILPNLDYSEYDNRKPTLKNLYKQFLEEGYSDNELKRQGTIPKVITGWLRGLPSTLNIPFYTYDIVNLMHALGYEVKDMESIDVDDLYWSELGKIIYLSRDEG
ncbi:MAG: hypothetical protein KGY51_12015, partial [Psychroflexus sp.]|nr:hypothetical protein [Psychroflexus sp.]